MRQWLAVVVVTVCAGVAAGEDVPGLIKQLKSGDVEARRNAAKSLGESGPAARDAVPALASALRDSDRFVRRFAAKALGEIGADAKAAVPALNTIVRENKDKKEVVDAAIDALGKIGDEKSSVGTLATTVRDTSRDMEVRRQAAESLGKMGSGAKAAIPALVEVLKPGKGMPPAGAGQLRAEAATALGEIASPDDKAAVDSLTTLSNDRMLRRDPTLRKSVNDALKKIQSKKS